MIDLLDLLHFLCAGDGHLVMAMYCEPDAVADVPQVQVSFIGRVST
jgi:hypothetical protein